MAWHGGQELILVAVQQGLMWVDPDTGDRSYLTGKETGSGPLPSAPNRIALRTSSAYVTDKNLGQIFEVDLVDGTRRVFWGAEDD